MPIDFPSSANTGDIYTEGVYSYEYTGVKWKPVRPDYTTQVNTDFERVDLVPYDSITIDFDSDGIQYLSANVGGEIFFTNPPEFEEYKRLTLDIDFKTDYVDINYDPYSPASDFTYENVQFDVTEATDVSGIAFKDDGTRMYIGDSANNEILEYSMSPDWDIANSSFVESHAIDTVFTDPIVYRTQTNFSSQTSSSSLSASLPAGIQDGDFIMFLVGIARDSTGGLSGGIVSSGWTLYGSHVSYSTNSLFIIVYYKFYQTGDPTTVTYSVNSDAHVGQFWVFRNVDQTLPILDSGKTSSSGHKPIFFDSNINFPDGGVNVVAGFSATASDVAYTSSGYNLFVANRRDNGGSINYGGGFSYSGNYTQLDSTTRNELSGEVNIGLSFTLNPRNITGTLKDIRFKNNGSDLFIGVTDGSLSSVKGFDLSTPWDVSSATETGRKYLSGALTSFDIGDSGNKAYAHISPSTFYEYSLDTAYDVSSTWTQTDTFSMSGKLAGFNSDGTKFFTVSDAATNNLTSYTMNAWTLTSASQESQATLDEGAGVVSASFRNDGYRFYTLNDTNNTVKQYLSSTVTFDSDPTIVWPTDLKWENVFAPTLPDAGENIQIEIEARTDFYGTNYIAKVLGRNY